MAGDIAVIGSFGITGAGGIHPGQAVVFTRTANGDFDGGAVLMPEMPSYGSTFPTGVATDGTTVAVAGVITTLTTATPAAWVYSRIGGSWTLDTVLTADESAIPVSESSGPPLLDTHVAISNDTLVLTAWSGEVKGAAYVFARTAGAWAKSGVVAPADGYPNDSFGSSVALSGDTMVVGAPSGIPIGDFGTHQAVYVFERVGAVWEQRAKLSPGSCGVANFGHAVATDSGKVVVGAFRALGPCQAYVFETAPP
jgi:hypothetical protein